MLLEMGPEDTGASVTHAMRQQRPELLDKQLRLIHSGRMLAAHTPLSMLRSASSLASHEESEEKHEGLSRLSLSLPTSWTQDKAKGKETADEDGEAAERDRIWLHCAATQIESPGDQDSIGNEAMTSEIPRAYDRLTDAGLSSSDVQSVRALFRRVMFGRNANTSSSSGPEGSTPAWAPSTAQAHELESQWLDSITQPSIFEESPSGSSDTESTSRTSSLLSYLLPTTIHGSPARATTQGLIFAFFFPFIAGSAVASEVLVRPPAFFDGEIWPELNREAVEMYAALSVDNESTQGATNGANSPHEDAAEEGGTQDREPLSSLPSEETAGLIGSSSPPRSRVRFFDTAVDPSPSLIFSPGMQTAVRYGLVLNFVTGFYLWLYAS